MATTDNDTNKRPLAGQVAIVTGAGRGIGREIARTFARAGAAVTVTARTVVEIEESAALIRAEGGIALAIPADVTDQVAVERMVARTESELGPVDILVNNAGEASVGISHATRPSWEDDPRGLWRQVEVNVFGSYLCAKAVIPQMVARRSGRIINVVSGAALRGWSRAMLYGPSKTMVVRWTEALANELTPYEVSVVSMEPGVVDTKMTRDGIEAGFEAFRTRFEAGKGTPVEDPARLALALATLDVGPLTGRFFFVNADVPELIRRADEIRKKELYLLRIHELPDQPIAPWRQR